MDEPTTFTPIRIQTDMALEARDIVRGDAHREIPGVAVNASRIGEVDITVVEIQEESAEKLMGKPRGRYVTMDVPEFRKRDPDVKSSLIGVITDQIKQMVPQGLDTSVLVVGLGNRNATPDALGPRVVDRLLVTRHLQEVLPADVRRRMRPVAAMAPGVLGTTGIETLDILHGVVQETRPDVVVAIDALAARNLNRLLSSVQLADTGIQPGAGVGNRRRGLNQESVGVPVVAIGVCTVVPSISIAQEALRWVSESLKGKARLFEVLDEMNKPELKALTEEVLGERLGDLMVTPKEVDLLIDDMADVLAEALNRGLQPRLNREEWQ